jgi:hypothetical protein
VNKVYTDTCEGGTAHLNIGRPQSSCNKTVDRKKQTFGFYAANIPPAKYAVWRLACGQEELVTGVEQLKI